jgi:hypothetical protein
MSNEAKLRIDASRGLNAARLLENELLADAFDTLEKSYIAAWRATHINDAQSREKLFLAINVVGKVRDHLTKVVNDGKLAEAELKSLERVAEPKKRFGLV